MLGSQFEVAGQHGGEVTKQSGHPVKKQRDRNTDAHLVLSLLLSPGPRPRELYHHPPLGLDFSTLIKLIEEISHRHAQRLVRFLST